MAKTTSSTKRTGLSGGTKGGGNQKPSTNSKLASRTPEQLEARRKRQVKALFKYDSVNGRELTDKMKKLVKAWEKAKTPKTRQRLDKAIERLSRSKTSREKIYSDLYRSSDKDMILGR